MKKMNFAKYKAFPVLEMPQRQWPNRVINKAPEWVSVDLRDGNQALEIPMSLDQKLTFFKQLVEMGFKTIEIGFPAASDTEYDFTRYLIEKQLIPDDVYIQVLTQSRPHIIERTYDALRGVRNAVVHLYNSTNTTQRRVVFRMSKNEVKQLAVNGAKLVKEFAEKDEYGTNFRFEYSPESFSLTEMDFAVEVCDAVCDVWQPGVDKKAIINLPNTVECATANVYADQIEYFCTHTRYRDKISVSLHAHNDRGCGVAATELALMAGADRVEGTLFGNGERTGNADILTLAMNLFSQGIDPELDFTDINALVATYEACTGMQVDPRQPYAGDLVYTAFSGSHQDAINKGMAALDKDGYWNVPYLPIDPKDVGRSYDPIIRINSQSGKGGVAFILEQKYGLILPKEIQQEFSKITTRVSDVRNSELQPEEIKNMFFETYVNISHPVNLINYKEAMLDESTVEVAAIVEFEGQNHEISGQGTGIVGVFFNALKELLGVEMDLTSYHQHAIDRSSGSKAMTYVQVLNNGKYYSGCGYSSSISKSSLRAVISAVNAYLSSFEQ